MSSSLETSGGKTRLLLLGAVAVGGLGVGLFLLLGGGSGVLGGRGGGAGGYRRELKNGALRFPADTDPHLATRVCLDAIRKAQVRSVGALVYLLRGPADTVFPGQKVKNGLRIRAPAGFIQFLQESYLPATCASESAAAAAAAQPPPSASSRGTAAYPLPVERPMMAQLVACDAVLRRLERERATPFDNANRAHVNLLQQLWVAAGKPLAAYARTGKQWGEFGFQGEDPTTDLRGGGVLALRQFVHFAQRQPQALRQMMEYNRKMHDARGDSWYLVAVVSFQFTAQLLLQRDHVFHVNHLQVLYDSVVPTAGVAGAVPAAPAAALGAMSGASGVAKCVSREARAADIAEKTQMSLPEAMVAAWTDGAYTSDAEAGFFLLHEKLMLHFKSSWEADKPHVMSYNTYVAEKVFGRFFTSSWTP